MKKLLFAIAGAASFAALAADPTPGANDIDVLGFENFDLTDTANVTGAVVGRTDSGVGGTSKWSYTGELNGDASLVKTYGGDNAAKGNGLTFPGPFEDEGDQYLALDTNGSELQRAVGATVAADGTYIDTLVQFTPSESAPTSTDLTGAKLAIWLGVENNVTNLYVQGNLWDFDSSPIGTSQAYALTGKTVEPGTWYRLTVKAIPNILGEDSGMAIPAFQICVDGTEMTLASAAFTAAFQEVLEQSSMYASAEIATAVAANKLVPSIQAEAGVYGATLTLASVGFKGTGAIDDFVVTTEAPDFTPPTVDFSLTWPSGLTAVSYQIGEGEPVAISGTSPFAVPSLVAGDVVKFIVQNADGATKTLTGTAGTDAGLDATGTTFGWAEYLGEAVAGAYTIDDADDLDMLRKGVAAGLATVGETFNQTANIDMSGKTAFAGIGTYAANLTGGTAFCGTYDGQGFKLSNLDFSQRNYGGVFNQVKGGTIKNLTVDTITCSTFSSEANSGEWGCAIIGNIGLGATAQGLTAMGSFGSASTPCTHNVAGIAIRVCGGASNVVDGVTMLETLVKDCTNNATLYGSYTKCAGITALTQDQNGVPNDYVLYDGCVNTANIAMVAGKGTEGRDGLAGILGYVADGTKMQNCVNNGTLTSVLATAKIGGIVGWAQGRTLDDLGGNTVPADQKMVGDQNGSTITGFKYATIDNGVATTVTTLAKDTEYLLEGNAAPTFELAADGDFIAFNTALGYTLDGTGITAAEGLTLTDATESGVTTYTAAAQGGDDYVVEIDGSDVVITPSAEDLAAVQAAVIAGGGTLDVTDVAAVNAAMAAPIGTTGVPAWQALFLGLPPTEAGLESFKIDSISIGADGNVTVALPASVDPKTGRGVTITLKLKAADTPNAVDWTDVESASGTTFAPFAPGSTDTKKFYKVVVDFAGSQN